MTTPNDGNLMGYFNLFNICLLYQPENLRYCIRRSKGRYIAAFDDNSRLNLYERHPLLYIRKALHNEIGNSNALFIILFL